MAFTPEEVKKGLHTKLISFLLDLNRDLEDSYNDIHIWSDSCCTIVDWCNVSYDSGDGRFDYVGEGEVIMIEEQFPDGHYEMCYDEEDFNERLEQFLKDNPGWVKTSYGTWTNEIENKKFQELMSKELDKNKDNVK